MVEGVWTEKGGGRWSGLRGEGVRIGGRVDTNGRPGWIVGILKTPGTPGSNETEDCFFGATVRVSEASFEPKRVGWIGISGRDDSCG